MSPTLDAPDGRAGPIRRLAIVGCGLIGGSLALATADLDGVERVAVTDRDPDVRDRAAGLGSPVTVTADLAQAVRGAELVVIAVPVPSIVACAREAVPWMDRGAILTDVGSVKSNVVRKVEGLRPRDVHYIGGHPMAGSERSGLEAASALLFQGATYILTPTRQADTGAFNRLSALLRRIGARVLAIEPELHDRAVAAVSHLPQLVASLLMANAGAQVEGTLAVAAGGFRDVTRVASSDPDLWLGILRGNRQAVLEALDAFGHRLSELRDAIAGDRWTAVGELLADARRMRAALVSKHVAGMLVDVVVPVTDRPGSLAEVTTALGEAGINVEDLSVRHASEGARGALVIAIAGEGEARRACRILAARGYAAHSEVR